MEIKSENPWVNQCLASLTRDWTPNAERSRESLHAKLAAGNHIRTWRLAPVAAAVCLAVFAWPGPRGIAQQLWDRYVLNRIDVVRVDLSQLPMTLHVTTNGWEQRVADAEEAERSAGFRPHLPAPGLKPELSVLSSMVVEQTVRNLPEWDGAILRMDIGPIVSAKYPDGVEIQQFRPIAFTAPAGFPLARFTEVAFRSLGVSAWEAHALGERFAANPSWLVDIPAGTVVNLRELRLQNGPALLIEKFEKATILRSTHDRLYAVTSPTPERSIQIAESLP